MRAYLSYFISRTTKLMTASTEWMEKNLPLMVLFGKGSIILSPQKVWRSRISRIVTVHKKLIRLKFFGADIWFLAHSEGKKSSWRINDSKFLVNVRSDETIDGQLQDNNIQKWTIMDWTDS